MPHPPSYRINLSDGQMRLLEQINRRLSMQKIKLNCKVIATALMLLALAPQGKALTQETYPPIFLLRTQCVDTGIGNWSRRTEDVAVGKAVYTSKMFVGPGDTNASLTCRIQPNTAGINFQTLQLGFGMRDNDVNSPPVTVKVYLDEVEAVSRNLIPGQPAEVELNIANIGNISLEATCSNSRRYCDRVYFWDASLVAEPMLPTSSK